MINTKKNKNKTLKSLTKLTTTSYLSKNFKHLKIKIYINNQNNPNL